MSDSNSDFSSNSMSDSDSAIFVSIHDLVKILFMSQCFQQKNTFDVLTFVRTVSQITTTFLTR